MHYLLTLYRRAWTGGSAYVEPPAVGLAAPLVLGHYEAYPVTIVLG